MHTASASLLTGGDAVAQALVDHGVEYFFNLPGNGVYGLLDALAEQPALQYRLALHEFSLIAMADGYARGSRTVPFVNVYMAPGLTNGLAAVYIAHRDRVPMVVTSTQQATTMTGRDAYATAPDQPGIARQFCKWAWELTTAERLPEAIHRAFKIAATHPQGPVFLSLPVDFLKTPVEKSLTSPDRPSAVPSYGAPPPNTLENIARLLTSAPGVAFICGKDVLTCNAVSEVEQLAWDIGAAVFVEPSMTTGVLPFPNHHPLALGPFEQGQHPLVAQGVQSSSSVGLFDPTLVFGIGARMFVDIAAPAPSLPDAVKVISIGLNADDLGRMQASDVSAVCDIRLGIAAIRAACAGRTDPDQRSRRIARIKQIRARLEAERRRVAEEHYADRPMSIARLAAEINAAVTPDTVIVEHATTAGPLLMEQLDLERPQDVFGTGSSVQGWGAPAAIGIQMARRDQPVLGIIGDGGFTFSCQALWSAVRYQVPVTLLVINNHGYRSMRGSVLKNSPRAAKKEMTYDFEFEVDIPHVARGFGVECHRVEEPTDLAEVLRQALRSHRPEIVEVMTSSAAGAIH